MLQATIFKKKKLSNLSFETQLILEIKNLNETHPDESVKSHTLNQNLFFKYFPKFN